MGSVDINDTVHTRKSFVAVTVTPCEWVFMEGAQIDTLQQGLSTWQYVSMYSNTTKVFDWRRELFKFNQPEWKEKLEWYSKVPVSEVGDRDRCLIK